MSQKNKKNPGCEPVPPTCYRPAYLQCRAPAHRIHQPLELVRACHNCTSAACNGCGEGPREQAPAAPGHGRRGAGRLLQRRRRRVGVRRGWQQQRLPGGLPVAAGRGAGRAQGVHAARLRGVPLHASLRRPRRGGGRRGGGHGCRDRGRPRGGAAAAGCCGGGGAPRRRMPAGPFRHRQNAGRAAPQQPVHRRRAEEEDGPADSSLAAVSSAVLEESPGSLMNARF